MIRPTCVKCGIELTCEKNEHPVIHFTNNDKKQGIDALCFGDLWKCSQCGNEVVIGLGTMICGHELDENTTDWILNNGYVEIRRKLYFH